MRLNCTTVLRQFKRNWVEQLQPEAIKEVCREEGLEWRKRLLDPPRTIQLFLLQVLHGNTACSTLRHLSKLRFTPTAYCRARRRIPLKAFELLLDRTGRRLSREEFKEGNWRGHRVFIVDGSSFTMPDTPELRTHFGQPKGQRKGCGFPVAHLLALFHYGTGMLQRVITGPLYTHDMRHVVGVHSDLAAGDLLLADRAFCTFAHISLLCCRGVDAVMRLHQARSVSFQIRRQVRNKGSAVLRKLGASDQIVEWRKPKREPAWMTAEQFKTLPSLLQLRILRYRISRKGFRSSEVILVTTLVCPKRYPASALAQLYGQRWTIETNLRHLKTSMGMEELHCRTVDGVLKELIVFCLVYNLVRLVMLAAAKAQKQLVSQISFLDALRWLALAAPDEPLPLLLVVPFRPSRHEPRRVKRRPTRFSLLTKPRTTLRLALQYQPLAA